MNDLNEIDEELLDSIKKRIEERAGLSGMNALSQKDFDFLLYYVQEKTGELLSLSTIKRIWRSEFQRLPHLSTLDMLARLAHDCDWHTLKKQFLEAKPEKLNGHQKPREVSAGISIKRSPTIPLLISGMLGIAAIAMTGYLIFDASGSDTSAIHFSAEPTADLSIPNSVVFSYDLKDYKADHFYLQQSWDPLRKVEVSPTNKNQTDIYFEPGYHYAKLLGDDRILKEIPVHIRYNDWFVRIRYPDSRLVRVNAEDMNTEGYLGIKPGYAQSLLDEDTFQLGYMLSKDFGLAADEFLLSASIRFDSLTTNPCPTVNVLIKGDKSYSWITLGNKGCESNLGLIFGDVVIDGKTSDLRSLGMDAYSWQEIKVKSAGGKYQLLINNEIVHEGVYSKKLGQLKEIDFFFNGIGAIDEINISDRENNSLLSQKF